MGQRLLVVDNDRAFLDEHKAALEAAFEVEYLAATDGAMPRLERGGIAAVLICVEVSENKGYALCSAIRRSPALQDLKIMLISAKATEEEYARHQSLKGRADVYLHKPMESEALVASLSPFVPVRAGEPDDLLGDLDGADLGDEWLESLKSELEVDFAPVSEPAQELEPATTRILPDAALEHRILELEALVRERDALLEARAPELAEPNGDSGDLDRLQFLEGAHAAAEEELARVRESLALSQERLQALESQAAPGGGTEEQDRELRLLRQDVAGLEGTLRGQRRELAEQAMRLQDLEKEAEDLRIRAATAENQVGELEASQSSLREEAEGVQREFESVRAQLLAKEQLVAQAETRCDEMEVRGAELQATLEQAEAEREVFRTDLDACQTRLAQAETELAEKSTLALRQEQELVALGEQFEAARSTRDRQAEELGELRMNLEALELGLLARQAELESLASEREQAQSRCADLEQQLQVRQVELGSLASERDQARARCVELEQRLAREAQDCETQRMELLAGIDERETALSRMKTTLQELEAHAQGLGKEKQELEGHLNERTARLDSLTNVISDLEAGIRRATDLTRPF
ncbi:response regulator [Holophaga foetida]|uniref:response regulator n=1 Tax=Holophaga foetida TaxID=35839 RepID=UPI00024725DC|nr:response regulator [Holophaga foetida]